MPATFVKGDLFEDAKDVPAPRAFAFPSDTSGAMDKGIAVAFKKRWPGLADAYRARAQGKKIQLGDVFTWREGDVIVYALAVQEAEKKPKVSTLVRALDAMVARAADDGVTRIALPRIGARKGGIDPVRVKRILTEAGDRSPVSLVVFEQFVRSTGDEQ